jgi:hypothetical protein
VEEGMNIARRCPFCNAPITVTDVTEPERRTSGLVYLRTDCVICRVRIEAAGVGLGGALAQMDSALEKRVGTTPGDWKIVPRGGRGR